MNDLYGPLDEKKKKRKKRKKAGSESSKESSLRDWFGRKGAKGKKKGWVDCNAPDGKGGYRSCGRSSGEKRKKYPACRPTPGACKERGKGKSWGKKAKKKKNEELYMDLEQIIKEELEAVLDEKRKKKKKKKKKKAKRDACYHKVKSRYKVWPSAYASGALVKCRKVGAKNWGNSKKESLQIMIEDEISLILNEKKDKYTPHDMYDPETGDKHNAKKKKDHLDMAKKGFVHIDPKKIEQILRDEGGAAGMKPFLKEFGEESEEEIVKTLENMPNVAQHEDGDYILDDDKEVDISEGLNCGCNQDPCRTYGKNNEKITIMVKEETENFLEESLYYGLIEEDEELDEKKKKACKPSKGKKFARRVKGKCVSYGQAGKAKGGGARIKPGTSKGNAYCARSYGDMKSHGKDCSGKDRGTPLCLSRQKWKCSGKYSRKGK
tara:strand:- start:142 stop:1446 length:1305 start_codon:yes stop_codon:yes gene_type:complete